MLYQNISFKYPFRDYQTRVLNTLDEKLSDNKIHIVAAPGSGKTVLGLEIVRRLDIPVLILVPSISIREQWIDRLLTLFVNESSKDYWMDKISDTLDNPGIITCITYQALYAKYEDTNIDLIADTLLKIGVRGIVLDEAHHLKREWWKALTELESKLNNPFVISLTATPPFDASSFEWNKYNNLCGEIDIELFTPEMVQKNSLAPYQDFVYLCVPSSDETAGLLNENFNVNNLFKSILESHELYKELSVSPLLTDTSNIPEVFLNNEGLLLALVGYLKVFGIKAAYNYETTEQAAKKIISSWNAELIKAADFSAKNIRNNSDNLGQVQDIFLKLIPVLIDGNDYISKEYKDYIISTLKNNHLLSNKKLSTEKYTEKIDHLLKHTSAKLTAISEIALNEIKSMNDDLSMLILVDNIGKENLSLIGTETVLSSIDCISVFEKLRRFDALEIDDFESNLVMGGEKASRLAVLCGSICILPSVVRLPDNMTSKELGNTGYKQIMISDSNRKSMVSFVTDLVNDKIINILIGTVSLLGEGWDAPAINTVILGSNVSSYVQSNQMRGRALRIDPASPDKTANIWHLCTLNPVNIDGETKYESSTEYRSLVNRFSSLLGIDSEGLNISNNIDRIHLPSDIESPFDKQFINEYNDFSMRYSTDRKLILNQWKQIVNTNDLGKVRESISIKEIKDKKLINTGQLSIHEINNLIKAIVISLKELNLINKDLKITINKSKYGSNKGITIQIDKCSSRERNLVLGSIKAVISPEKFGRYIINKKTFLRGSVILGIPEPLKTKANIEKFIKYSHLTGLELLETKSSKAVNLIFKNSLREKRILTNILKCGN